MNNSLPHHHIHSQWCDDLLGPDYQQLSIPLGDDPDGEGEVTTTLVRYLPSTTKMPATTRPAVLHIHGMTDYFFHTHVAEYFHQQGYSFYGIDLRKCGRSHHKGQSWHYVSDLSLYFSDLSAAVEVLSQTHDKVIVIGHSTGGLIASLWLDQLRVSRNDLHQKISALILNSPWLDMMMNRNLRAALWPVINLLGKLQPRWRIAGGNLGPYGASIHHSQAGEWDFDTSMKPLGGHHKLFGWVRAIMAGQRRIHRGEIKTGVPTLVLSSHRSSLRQPLSSLSYKADTVVDVEEISLWSAKLATDITYIQIINGMHDLFLSPREVRNEALRCCTTWLSQRKLR